VLQDLLEGLHELLALVLEHAVVVHHAVLQHRVREHFAHLLDRGLVLEARERDADDALGLVERRLLQLCSLMRQNMM